jgi:hypothetical protein
VTDDSITPCGLAAGRARRDAALSALVAQRADLIRRAERSLLTILLRRGQATIDDVRPELEPLPDDCRPVWLGAVPKPLLAGGIIERVGFAMSERPESHARPVSIWRLIDRDAAVRRLAELSGISGRTSAPAAVGIATSAQPLLF